MALTERQRTRLRGALDGLLRAEDAIAAVADELARAGDTEADAALDRSAALLRQAIDVLEPLAAGRPRRG
jgi:hypothetical protein